MHSLDVRNYIHCTMYVIVYIRIYFLICVRYSHIVIIRGYEL